MSFLACRPPEFHCSRCCLSFPSDPILMSLKEGYQKTSKVVFKAPLREKKSVVVNGIDLLENVPPRTENEVRREPRPPAGHSTAEPYGLWTLTSPAVLSPAAAAAPTPRRLPGSRCHIDPPTLSFSPPLKLLRMFFRQQDEIRRLKGELSQKDIRIRQLQLELKNLRNSPKNNEL